MQSMNLVTLLLIASFPIMLNGYAKSFSEGVDCTSCVTSGSTYTWWQDGGGKYTCTDSFWDESICPMYDTCTF